MPAQPAASHTGTATILFTDLVDSTAQRARLGRRRTLREPPLRTRVILDSPAAQPPQSPDLHCSSATRENPNCHRVRAHAHSRGLTGFGTQLKPWGEQ
jgi:hypothetical protein